MIKDLFGTLVIVDVNEINHVLSEKNYILKIVNVEKDYLNVVKMLMEIK